MKRKTLVLLSIPSLSGSHILLNVQPVFTPWGNVAGMKIEGEKMEFETSLRAVDPEGMKEMIM